METSELAFRSKELTACDAKEFRFGHRKLADGAAGGLRRHHGTNRPSRAYRAERVDVKPLRRTEIDARVARIEARVTTARRPGPDPRVPTLKKREIGSNQRLTGVLVASFAVEPGGDRHHQSRKHTKSMDVGLTAQSARGFTMMARDCARIGGFGADRGVMRKLTCVPRARVAPRGPLGTPSTLTTRSGRTDQGISRTAPCRQGGYTEIWPLVGGYRGTKLRMTRARMARCESVAGPSGVLWYLENLSGRT